MSEKNIFNGIIISYCGLICNHCKSFLKEKCSGCREVNEKTQNCKVKKCASEHDVFICSDCSVHTDYFNCKKNNTSSFKFSAVFNGKDRPGNLNEIKKKGLDAFLKKRLN